MVVAQAGADPESRPPNDHRGNRMERSRLISADSHVAVRLDVIRERIPSTLQPAFDEAIAQQAREEDERRARPKALAR